MVRPLLPMAVTAVIAVVQHGSFGAVVWSNISDTYASYSSATNVNFSSISQRRDNGVEKRKAAIGVFA